MNTKQFTKKFYVGGVKVEAVKLNDETPMGYKVYSLHTEDDETSHARSMAVLRYMKAEGFSEEFFLDNSPTN